jgi:hypothetical protein
MEKQAELYSALGGPAILDEVAVRETDVVHLAYYADIVKEKSRRRRLKERALAVADSADDDSKAIGELLDEANFGDLEMAPRDHFTLRALRAAYPNLHDPVIDGLVRRGEVANIVAPSKIGKSWLTYGLALSIITGRDWFCFPTRPGRVLLIDNELHRATIVQRLVCVGEAMGLALDDYADLLSIWPLRGKGEDVFAIGRRLNRIPRFFYSFIILDAKYRALPAGTNENDNSAEAQFYNEQDRWAERLEAGVANVHHSTKGGQGEKRVTDVGAGGGAQSRAADTHIAIREHEEPGVFVLDAAVRSFAPIEPIGLRWSFPLWMPDAEVDPSKLKRQTTRQQERQTAQDAEADRLVLDACVTWLTFGEIRKATGLGDQRATRSVARLLSAKFLNHDKQNRPRNPDTDVYRRSIHAAS